MVAVSLFLAGIFLTLLAFAALRHLLPKQTNYRGQNIPGATGVLFIPIILVTLVLVLVNTVAGGKSLVFYLVYALVCGVMGYVDDVWGGTQSRGFRGHLGALARGKVTTGALKIFVLGGGAVMVGFAVFGPGWRALAAAFLLAGSVNTANLLDLRPGRTIKFLGVPVLVLLSLASYTVVTVVIGIIGAVTSLFYFDLKGRMMLGDAGAAIYGSVLGYLILVEGPGIIWWLAGLFIVGVTVLAEVSSISRVIQEVETLRRFDRWGRGVDE